LFVILMKGSSHARQKREACWQRQTEILATGGLRGRGGREKWRGEIDEGEDELQPLDSRTLGQGAQRRRGSPEIIRLKAKAAAQNAEPYTDDSSGEEEEDYGEDADSLHSGPINPERSVTAPLTLPSAIDHHYYHWIRPKLHNGGLSVIKLIIQKQSVETSRSLRFGTNL
ncbi:hypothetical protein D4764_12G0005260, partial [Takifugu flavidus]